MVILRRAQMTAKKRAQEILLTRAFSGPIDDRASAAAICYSEGMQGAKRCADGGYQRVMR